MLQFVCIWLACKCVQYIIFYLFSSCICNYFFNIPAHARIIYTLKSTKIHIKTLDDNVSLSKEHQTHTQMDCNDIQPQIAKFHNECISTDLNMET
jgi:hypothetical protein